MDPEPCARSAPSSRGFSRACARLRRDVFERPAGNDAALDGLRGLAVLAVLAFHCAIFSSYATPDMEAAGQLSFVQQWLINMWSGVDVFFVLSGFLIGRNLLRDLRGQGRLFWPSFIVRRSFRIIPAYYLVLSVIVFAIAPRAPGIYAYLWGTQDFPQLSANAWANYLYLSNYWLAPGEANPMSWAWSLCIEEHFYLVLPPLLWLTVRRRAVAWHAFGLGIGLGFPFLARAVAYATQPEGPMGSVYEFSHYRFDELFVGVVVAYLHLYRRRALQRCVERAGLVLPALGAAALLLVWSFGSARQGGAFAVMVQFPLLSWGTAALLVHAIHAPDSSPVRRALEWNGWYPIARVSYGMYLVHPVVVFALIAGPLRPILEQPGENSGWVPEQGALLLVLFVCVSFVSWLCAALMFSTFERPLQRLGAQLASRLRGAQNARVRG